MTPWEWRVYRGADDTTGSRWTHSRAQAEAEVDRIEREEPDVKAVRVRGPRYDRLYTRDADGAFAYAPNTAAVSS